MDNNKELYESINNVLNKVELEEGKLPSPILKKVKNDVKLAKSSLNGAVEYLGDIAGDVQPYDDALNKQLITAYRELLKAQTALNKIKV
jgi:hypothetical protein